MIEKNTICHYLNLDGICLTLADITDAALEAAKRHNMSDQAAAMLGEIMAGTAILATDFKNHEGVSLRWDAHGPRGNIHTDAYEGKYLRGYMDHPEAAGADESILNEHGMLYVTRYSLLRMPYTSSVELKGHDVSSCLTDYMKESDQTLSHIQTAVIRDEQGRIQRVFAFMAQLMPQGNKDKFKEYFSINYHFAGESHAAESVEDLLKKGKFSLLGKMDVSFRCTCSAERIKSALLSLNAHDRAEILKDDKVEATCEYCGSHYSIPRELVALWFEEEKGSNVQ